jgi:hypothetical protein
MSGLQFSRLDGRTNEKVHGSRRPKNALEREGYPPGKQAIALGRKGSNGLQAEKPRVSPKIVEEEA